MVDLLGRLSNQASPPVDHLSPDDQPVRQVVGADRTVHRGRRARRLTKGQIEGLIAQYQAGAPIESLMSDFDITRQTLFQHVKRSGIAKRTDVSRWTDAQLQEATNLYLGGASLSSVGRQFGIGATTVWNRLRAAGVTLKPRPGSQESTPAT